MLKAIISNLTVIIIVGKNTQITLNDKWFG
jgi:hypothetical protein